MLILSSSMIFIVTLSALLTMISQRRHLLMALMALEAVMLSVTLIIIIHSSPNELFMSFVILTVAACEASLGLACLVVITRSSGNDLFKSLSSNKC